MKYTINSESIYGTFMLAVAWATGRESTTCKKFFLNNFQRFSLWRSLGAPPPSLPWSDLRKKIGRLSVRTLDPLITVIENVFQLPRFYLFDVHKLSVWAFFKSELHSSISNIPIYVRPYCVSTWVHVMRGSGYHGQRKDCAA